MTRIMARIAKRRGNRSVEISDTSILKLDPRCARRFGSSDPRSRASGQSGSCC